jgi:hypothetical protein
MNTISRLALAGKILLLTTSGIHAQEKLSAPPAEAPPPQADPISAWMDATFPEFLVKGKLHLNLRLRYEYADQDQLRHSHAPTFRTRLGYETAPLHGFRAMAEFEDVRIIGNEHNFNQAGLSGPGRTVIADVRSTELNQGWLSYQNWDTTLRGGRQRIILDNHRFVGNVGWRQNEQTYDAISIQNKSLPDSTLFYGYLWQVNRIFSNRHPLGRFDSDSHLFNFSHRGLPWGSLTAYAYLLAFDNSPANSSATFGGHFSGSHAFHQESNTRILYRAEYAHQRHYANQPVNYSTHFYNFELGGEYHQFSLGAGYEVLGSDNNKGFATPLATLHAFNGWADVFLVTPPEGLRDAYAWAGVTLPYDVPFRVIYHNYWSDRGADYGHEWNAILSRKFGKYLTALIKFASYDGKPPFNDVHRFWAQLEFAY